MTATHSGSPASERPTVGLLGIMQELYDDMLPGITERQGQYAQKIADSLSESVDVIFDRPARNRSDIEQQVRRFNGIMIVMLTYGPAMRTVRALSENQLPVMLANVQPERTITEDWDMADLTYNQGVHGAQDMANTLLRLGINAPIISEDWRTDRFREFVSDWAHAAQASQSLRDMRLAQFGQMPGMGDIATDPSAFMRTLGPQVDQLSMGLVDERMQAASDDAVAEVVAADEERFEIDDDLSKEAHSYAARFQVAIEDLLTDEGYEGFSMYFDAVGDDGRFEQLHMLAASNLMAKGYGYAAEGDMPCTGLVAAGHRIAPDAHFTEMYAMDFERNSILQSHMGEGNWKIARKDRPVKLIDRPLGIGGLDNPPTVLFMAEPGPATICSLVPLGGDKFRLVLMKGEVMDHEGYPTIEMPYFHFKPANGVRTANTNWLKAGGTHHQCLLLGDQSRRWQMLAEMLGIDLVEA